MTTETTVLDVSGLGSIAYSGSEFHTVGINRLELVTNVRQLEPDSRLAQALGRAQQ